MSRVLAPKFSGFLTFAALRDESSTAPGQPTLDDLLGLYRFRSINPKTLVYGILGWPVSHSMSLLTHNAGFEAVGHEGVYLPMPIPADPDDPEGSDASFKATVSSLLSDPLDLRGVSVTIPHKERLVRFATAAGWATSSCEAVGAANTLSGVPDALAITNTDALAIASLLAVSDLREGPVGVVGAGGVARAAVAAAVAQGRSVLICNRNRERAESLADSFAPAEACEPQDLSACAAIINCTPVGMLGGPDPERLSIPLDDLPPLPPETVIFDTVYNPIETPLIRAARERGLTVIDGVQMFVKQAAHQFELWTGEEAPEALFDRLVRERLG